VFDVWRSLAAPVIFRVLHAADDLALAAELKGIGRRDLVPVRESAPLSRRDAVVLAAAAMAVAVAVGLQMNTNMSAGLFGAGG
jgi:energy-coupling factor transporter transmembrane protein EcfT